MSVFKRIIYHFRASMTHNCVLHTGCGLPPGPRGALGAAEGLSYLALAATAAWALLASFRSESTTPTQGQPATCIMLCPAVSQPQDRQRVMCCTEFSFALSCCEMCSMEQKFRKPPPSLCLAALQANVSLLGKAACKLAATCAMPLLHSMLYTSAVLANMSDVRCRA